MARTNCENCMWGDQCCVDGKCDYYHPLNQDYDEEYLTQFNSKEDFYEEWNRYILLWDYDEEGVYHCS